jgi:hypothetical protein
MKNIIRSFLTVALLFSFASCKKDKADAAFSIDGINLNGVKYLALGSAGTNAKSDDRQQMLYSIDENGNMQLVAYNYQCDDDGLVTEIQRNIGITITQIVPVGDRYIWLVGCRYYCDDYSGFSESMQERIRGMVQHSIEYSVGFLIRKSDGKIFETSFNGLPAETFNVPGYGNVTVVCNAGSPIDGEISAEKLRKLGLINQIGSDIYLANGSYQGGLVKLKDNGSSISVINVLPANIAYSVADGQGHLGTCISYESNTPQVAAIMASDGTLPAIPGIPTNSNPRMHCIAGKYFVSVNVPVYVGDEYHGSYDSIFRVDINGSQVTSTSVAEGYLGTREGVELYNGNPHYVCDEETYTWYSGSTLYSFNSSTYRISETSLPAGWPSYSEFDADGFCYRPHTASAGLQSFTIYNLATLQDETVTCNRSQVPTFNLMSSCNYDGGLHAFIESLIMADGSTVTIVTPVTGPDRGKSYVQSQTGANNNIEVTTLIPLN